MYRWSTFVRASDVISSVLQYCNWWYSWTVKCFFATFYSLYISRVKLNMLASKPDFYNIIQYLLHDMFNSKPQYSYLLNFNVIRVKTIVHFLKIKFMTSLTRCLFHLYEQFDASWDCLFVKTVSRKCYIWIFRDQCVFSRVSCS